MIKNPAIIHWVLKNNIKTSAGQPYDLKTHLYLWQILQDFSKDLVLMKAAQIGATEGQILKKIWGIDHYKIDGITTFPTISDAQDVAGNKVNRLVANNPVLTKMISSDKDTVGMKKIGKNMWNIRGTFTEKAAMMISSDWNDADELDASKQEIIEQYDTRLQHSQYSWRHYYSHPSSEGFGIHKKFLESDQKHWFIKCEKCKKEQYLSFPESIDEERQCFQCKYCHEELRDEDRRVGRWVAKFNKDVSGYWIPLLICKWVSAKQILTYQKEKSPMYFYNKVLGLPYVGSGNKITYDVIMRNVRSGVHLQEERIVIGLDTGTTLWYVIGDKNGVFHYGSCKDYEEIEGFLNRWKNSILICDQGGDLIGPRKLQEKYRGRVFLCHYRQDRKTQQLITWGKGVEMGTVIVDRNRLIQLVVDELTDKRIPLWGTVEDWYDFYTHCANVYRVEEENALGVPVKKWERSGPDHLLHALVYWRTGVSRFANQAEFGKIELGIPESPIIENDTVKAPKVEGAPMPDWDIYN